MQKHEALVEKKKMDQTKQSVTSLEHHLKRSNNANQRSQKEVSKALNSAKTLRHQIKILEARVEKQRKVISQTEEERNHYLQESTEQVILTSIDSKPSMQKSLNFHAKK